MRARYTWLGRVTLGLVLLATACGEEEPPRRILIPATHSEAMTQAAQDEASTWAMRWSIPVRWSRNVGVEGGTGTLVYHTKSTATHQGATRIDAVRLCGLQQPSYKLNRFLGNETYQTHYPDALFDGTSLPAVTMTFTFDEEGSFVAQPVAMQLGVALDAPERAPWPAWGQPLPGTLVEQTPGQPGIATHMRMDSGFIAPPVDMYRTRRAETFYIAMRHLIGASGGLSDEGYGEGQARVGGIGGKAALNTRVLGCALSDGSACGANELHSLNTYSPAYAVAGRGSFVMMRVARDTDCASIRGLSFERGGAPAL